MKFEYFRTKEGIRSIASIVISIILFVITLRACKLNINIPFDADYTQIDYLEFKEKLSNKAFKEIYYDEKISKIYLVDNDGTTEQTINPFTDDTRIQILESGALVKQTGELNTGDKVYSARISIFAIIFGVTWIILLTYLVKGYESYNSNEIKVLRRKQKKVAVDSPERPMSSIEAMEGKSSKVEEYDADFKTFDDIAGLKEVKKDMRCLVDFLVHKDRYIKAGAKLPKGVILYGPPGTGKTLLAKAVANEADVPFIYMSGSDFIEMYVGVGAKRIRDLFNQARKQSPCIIFIDEIDAIGGKRREDSNGEDRKTINALLTEMDGFEESEDIIVIAATNRIEDLDSALLRPGRFTDKFCVPLPETSEERLEIINLYTRNKHLDETVDINLLAKETVGFSPAKIEALLNEAAIISVQNGRCYISKEDVENAMYKILLQGHMKEDAKRDAKELELVAWHEAGHALVGRLYGKEITKVTIISSTSGAGGVTFSTPGKLGLHTVEDLEHEVMELYGGRIAELILNDDNKAKITTGASNDIERATSIIHEIVTKYGMNERFGLLNLEASGVDKEFIIKEEVAIARRLEKNTYEIIHNNYTKLKSIAELLLEKETIRSEDLNAII